MLSNITTRLSTQDRENDLQAAERLTGVIATLAALGDADQRRGRDRAGKFVAAPPAIDAQLELEKALLSVAKRIKERE